MTTEPQTVTILVPFTIRRRSGRKHIVSPDGIAPWASARPHINSTMVKAPRGRSGAGRWRRPVFPSR